MGHVCIIQKVASFGQSPTSPATEMEDPAPFWKKQGKKGHFFQKNLPNNGKKIMEKIFQIMEKKMEQTMEGTAL